MEKLPGVLRLSFSELSRQQNSTIELLLNRGGGGNEGTGGGAPVSKSMRAVSVGYGHLIKHRNAARISGEAEEEGGAGWWGLIRELLANCPSLSWQRGRKRNGKGGQTNFSTNGNERSFSWVQKNHEEVPVGVSEGSWQGGVAKVESSTRFRTINNVKKTRTHATKPQNDSINNPVITKIS